MNKICYVYKNNDFCASIPLYTHNQHLFYYLSPPALILIAYEIR